MIAFIHQLRQRTPLGWLQLRKEKSRLLVALSGIAFADVLMFMQLGFMNALYDSNTRLNRSLNADIVLLSPKARNTQNLSFFSRRRLYQTMDIAGVQSAEATYISTISWKNPQTRRDTTVQVIGFDPDRPAFKLAEIERQANKLKLQDNVIFDRGARGEYQEIIAQIDSGEVKNIKTEIERRTITISGLFSLGASFGADGSVVTSQENFLRMFPRRVVGSVSLGLIKIEPGYDAKQVAMAIAAHLPNDVNVLTLDEFVAFEKSYWNKESPIGFIFSLGTVMAFIVGVVIVYQVDRKSVV